MLPSPSVFEQQARQQGLRVEKAFAFGQDYGRTLAEWAKRFESQRARINALGFDERFIRMWRFYLRIARPDLLRAISMSCSTPSVTPNGPPE